MAHMVKLEFAFQISSVAVKDINLKLHKSSYPCLDMVYCVITKTCFVSVLSAKSLQNCVKKDMPDSHSLD
jgi:hypothetical protein